MNVNQDEIKYYDFVCSAGGMKGMYLSYCVKYLIEDVKNIKFVRASGASAGSFAAVCALCHLDLSPTVNIYKRIYNECNGKKFWVGNIMREYCETIFPDNIHLLCNKNLFISINEITPIGIKRRIINEWNSRQDLIDCIMASSTIPYFTLPILYYKFRNMKCIDGIYPYYFNDNQREIIYCNLLDIPYPNHYSLNISDPEIHYFSLKGLEHFKKWLYNIQNNNQHELKHNNVFYLVKKLNYKKNHFLFEMFMGNIFLIGLFISLFIIYKKKYLIK